MLIPQEALPYFENQIYLPMIVQVLERDRRLMEAGAFKFPGVYVELIDATLQLVHQEIQETATYLRKHKMKVLKEQTEVTFTTYAFFYGGYEERRKYLNVRLKNRTEELIKLFLWRASRP